MLRSHGEDDLAARASSITVDVLERTGRDLRRHHTDSEIAFGWSEEPDASEGARDRELRLHAAEKQLPDPGQLNGDGSEAPSSCCVGAQATPQAASIRL